MLGLDLGKNDYYCHKKGRGNGRVTADPMVLWALAHRSVKYNVRGKANLFDARSLSEHRSSSESALTRDALAVR
jgi:hypothetical protein